VRSALPGAVQCGDRWHLWHLLGEAAAKEVAAHSACWAEAAPLQQGKRAETTLERWRQVHDLRSRGAGLLDCSRRLGLSLNTVKRYDRASEPERLQRVPKYRPTLVDPYRDYLRRRREEEPGASVRQLLREIRERGYPGSSNLLVRYINQGRLDTERPHIAPRTATQILLTNPENLPGDQRETAGRLSAACPEMKAPARLIGKFAAMLDPDPANEDRLLEWIAGARAAGLPHLHSFTRGLELDIKVLRDVDHEDVRDADLGDVLAVENPAGRGPAGLGSARAVAGGAQGVAVTSVMAERAAAWSAMACPAAQAAISEATHRLLTVRGRPLLVSWIRVIASSLNRVSLPRPARAR
jgi:hypothetical protein